MTEIKKGTPVWVWDYDKENKRKATYLCYDDLSSDNKWRHMALPENRETVSLYSNAEPISEKEEAMKRIAEAKEKIAEAEKLLNAL
mgnify:CR=1 FL=1